MPGRTIGEAFVSIRPDVSGTGAEVERDLGRELDGTGKKQGRKVGRSFGDEVIKAATGSGDDSAGGFFARFSGRVGPLMAGLPISGPLGTAVAAAGAAAAPVLVGALSAGLTAGIGGAVLGVGLTAAAKDPEVEAAGKLAGQRFTDAVGVKAIKAFKGPMLESLDVLDKAGARTAKRLGKAFDALAPSIEPLTRDLTVSADLLSGAVATGAERSGPALKATGDAMVLLSSGTASFIDSITAGGPAAADNLRLIAGATSDVVSFSGQAIKVFNQLANNPWITGPLLPLLKGHYRDVADETKRATEAAPGLDSAYQTVVPRLNDVAGAAAPVALSFQQIATAAGLISDANTGLFASETNVAQAIADASAKLKENGKGLDVNTTKGRENRTALTNVATALKNQFDAYVAVNGATPETKRLADELRAKFIGLAEKAGLSATEANALANAILGIPKSKDIKIHANTHDAAGRLAALQAKVDALHGRELTIAVAYAVTGSKASRSAIAAALGKQSLPARAAGGPVLAGNAYIVGERRRPEIFVPDRDGTVFPDASRFTLRNAAPGPRMDVVVAELRLLRAAVEKVAPGVTSGVSRAVRGVDATIGAASDLYSRGAW